MSPVCSEPASSRPDTEVLAPGVRKISPTDMRSGLVSALASGSEFTSSSTSVGPEYHDAADPDAFLTKLSPWRPDTGTKAMFLAWNPVAERKPEIWFRI